MCILYNKNNILSIEEILGYYFYFRRPKNKSYSKKNRW